MSETSVVLIHKIPAMWEIEAKGSKLDFINLSDSFAEMSDISENENSMFKNLENDIFYLFSRSVANYLGINKLDIILGYDEMEKRNWDVISRNGKFKNGDKFTFWSTNSPSFFPNIGPIDVLILRGNYPHFHNFLINKFKPIVTIFYPATSLLFPHFEKRMNTFLPSVLNGEVHENILNEMLINISKESIFSNLQAPLLPKNNNFSEILEFRKLFKNYFLSAISISNKRRNRKSIGNYSIVLYDEEENLDSLREIYPNSRLLKFNKPASLPFQFDVESKRDIDIIFTGTTLQKTKNFDVFYTIVDDMISKNSNIKICIVGVTEDFGELNNRWDINNVMIFNRVSKSQLSELYNRSKIHLITSGRDCFPRTIPESVICGCFVMVLDILSDGLSVIRNNPLIGKIIGTNDQMYLFGESFSPSIKILDPSISIEILKELNVKRDHLLIAALGSEIFSIEKMVQLDIIWQEIDLGLSNL